eukprot:264365_1
MRLRMNIIQSFDSINSGMICGVVNGHIQEGKSIEIRPGFCKRKQLIKYKKKCDRWKNKYQPQWSVTPITAVVKSLQHEKQCISTGYSGAVILETNVDPTLTRADMLSGQLIIGANNPIAPHVFNKFVMSYSFLSSEMKQKRWGKYETVLITVCGQCVKAEIVQTNANL